jgi:4-carboxymuconolactone decarboxylase
VRPGDPCPSAATAQERFPPIPPDQLTPEQKRLADAVQGGPRASIPGRSNTLGGPFNPWLRSPAAGYRLQALGEELRFRSSIPAALNEFAILITAREWSSQYEWHAHHRLAMQAGLPASVAAGKPKMVARVAVAHKLLTILNAILHNKPP